MDRNLHDIDKLFKNALEDFSDAPSDKVWYGLDRHLDKKKTLWATHRYSKWQWVAAAMFIVSFGMAMYTVHLKQKYKAQVAMRQPAARSGGAMGRAGKRYTLPVATNTIAAPTTVDKTVPATAQPSKTTADATAPAATTPVAVATTANVKQAVTSSIKKATAAIFKVAVMKAAAIGDGIDVSDQAFNDIERLAALQQQATANLLVAKSIDLNIAPAPTLQAGKTSLLNTALRVGKASQKAITPPPAHTGFAISVYASRDAVTSEVMADRPAFREDDRRAIEMNEHPAASSTVGLIVSKNISPGFSVVSGAAVSTRRTTITPKTLFARPDGRGDIGYRISCSAGYAFVPAKGSVGVAPGDSTLALAADIRLQYVSVPVGLQYHLYAGRFSLNPTALLTANFKTGGTIETVLQGNNDARQKTPIEGLQSAYFDGTLRLDLTYNLTRTVGVSVYPSARFGLSSITANSPVKTYVNTYGLGAGLQFRF